MSKKPGSSSDNHKEGVTETNLGSVSEFNNVQPNEVKVRRRIVWVMKNLIDQTAGLSYCLGVSIVHLSMFVVLFFVQKPDLAKAIAANVSDACLIEAEKWEFLLTFCNTTHIIMFVANSYREIFSAQTDMFGQFMRLVEVGCIPVYLFQVLSSIELLSIAMIRQETTDPTKNDYIIGNPKKRDYLVQCTRGEFATFQGTAMEWLIIEVLVFGFFLITMLYTMCKSRFISVGMDNSN